MSSLPSHSRRALVAASAAALAAVPTAHAKAKKKGKGKGKKKPPLAFATAVVTELHTVSADEFVFFVQIGYIAPTFGILNSLGMLAGAAPTNIEAGLEAFVRERVRLELEGSGVDVPAERVAVTLL